ncbi:hypothetical protein B296_00001100 [Ensete ventricosum]|uniref:Uncharacterized protein n=1 Tax=Ensete ventricosum TaxID=4639 RepID=A0A427BBG2_ENSVE|nr:hypothetical protein B296_00001100 [Ensete ventricosum]
MSGFTLFELFRCVACVGPTADACIVVFGFFSLIHVTGSTLFELFRDIPCVGPTADACIVVFGFFSLIHVTGAHLRELRQDPRFSSSPEIYRAWDPQPMHVSDTRTLFELFRCIPCVGPTADALAPPSKVAQIKSSPENRLAVGRRIPSRSALCRCSWVSDIPMEMSVPNEVFDLVFEVMALLRIRVSGFGVARVESRGWLTDRATVMPRVPDLTLVVGYRCPSKLG